MSNAQHSDLFERLSPCATRFDAFAFVFDHVKLLIERRQIVRHSREAQVSTTRFLLVVRENAGRGRVRPRAALVIFL